MDNIKISIIVPVYNVEKYLDQCLGSLVNQTLKEIEIICVNDGSIDTSLNIIMQYARGDNRIKVIDQPNSGVSVARNEALKQISGEYFMFVDSDDWLDIEACEIAYANITEAGADCLMFSYTKEFGKHQIINHIFKNDQIKWEFQEVKDLFFRRLFGPIDCELSRPQDMDITVSPCMQLFKASKYSQIPFIDIRQIGTFEDGLFQIDVYKNCDRFVYIDKPLYHYRRTVSTSITTQYKPDLYKTWIVLFEIMQSYIKSWSLSEEYQLALQNRIAISILGIGLNQVRSNDNIFEGANKMKRILVMTQYHKAIQAIDISNMPYWWKMFFFFAKHRLSLLLIVYLKLIEFIRTNR